MPAPFYNDIKGNTAGAAGTGDFTPSGTTGHRDWSKVPAGWIGLVRFEDPSVGANDFELSWSYWNGTTLTRGANQLYDSSTGSRLSLTATATAAMVASAGDIMSHIGTTKWAAWIANQGSSTTLSGIGIQNATQTGTAAVGALATTNYLTEQVRVQLTSATTANAQAAHSTTATIAVVSTAAGGGGFEFICRWGVSQIPTGMRLMIGMLSSTFIGNTGEPSALVANVAVFAKDSTDTNIQLLVNSNAGSGTKTDTGIAAVANGWYESAVWCEPGSNKVYGLLIRMDTGAIWYGSTTTDVPANGALMFPQEIAGLSSTTGTAVILHTASISIRSGQ